ncbi:MAG: S-layer homology domain-containing protein [Armatimonadota bacterium]|nr:MAG: S-layer homology domain-containing protein [Armatimonadota bacterium]
MDDRTRRNIRWLDGRYRCGVPGDLYYAHEPIYGAGCSYSEAFHAVRFARTYSLFRRLAQMEFGSLLDVGGAEGYHANLVRRLFSAEVVTSDLSVEANLRARELFGLPAVASDAHWLPYEDESFDVVLCCEVLEHVSDPVAVMCEVARVARRYAIFTTEQICRFEREREILLLLTDTESPHSELHWFLPEDFVTVLGGEVTCERQSETTRRCSELLSVGEEPLPEEVREIVLEMTRVGRPTERDHGILVVKAKGGAPPVETSRPGDAGLLDRILAEKVLPGQLGQQRSALLDPWLKDKLRCPACLSELEEARDHLGCVQCGHRFDLERGIPCLHFSEEQGERLPAGRPRGPWLTEEGERLRGLFRAPRPATSRLLCYALNLELNLLNVCREVEAPEADYALSGELRRALERALPGISLPDSVSRAQFSWWGRLPASEVELAAMRGLGETTVKLVAKTARRRRLDRIRASLPVRVLLRAVRAVSEGLLLCRKASRGRAARGGVALVGQDGLFHPDWAASRGEMAILIARAAAGGEEQVPKHTGGQSFPDVPPEDTAYDYVEYVLGRGIVSGYRDGMYHPRRWVDRGQMAVFLARALAGGEANVPEHTGEPSFPDVPPDAPIYKYVECARRGKVISGLPDGSYRPEQWLDRGQMAVFVARLAAGGEARIPEGPAAPTFPDVTPEPDDPYSGCYKYVEYLVSKGIVGRPRS